MKKKQVKKYAHELLKSMSFRSDARDMGYPHYKKTRALPIKGKRARRIMVDEVIDYINDHIRPLSCYYDKHERVFNDSTTYYVDCYVGDNLISDEFLIHELIKNEWAQPKESWNVEGKTVYHRPTSYNPYPNYRDEMDYASQVERRYAPTGKDYFVCGDWNHRFRFPGSEKSGVWGYGREMWYSHGDAWRQGNLEVYYRGEWHKVVGDAKHTDTRPAD